MKNPLFVCYIRGCINLSLDAEWNLKVIDHHFPDNEKVGKHVFKFQSSTFIYLCFHFSIQLWIVNNPSNHYFERNEICHQNHFIVASKGLKSDGEVPVWYWNCVLMLHWIAQNRTVLTSKLRKLSKCISLLYAWKLTKFQW